MSISFPNLRGRVRMRAIFLSLSILVVVAAAGAWWAYSAFWQPPHERAILGGNEGAVRAVAYWPDGKLLASGVEDPQTPLTVHSPAKQDPTTKRHQGREQ